MGIGMAVLYSLACETVRMLRRLTNARSRRDAAVAARRSRKLGPADGSI
jgi:hypothetical protein